VTIGESPGGVSQAADRGTLDAVTTAKEKLRAAVEELSETEVADALGYLASRHDVEADLSREQRSRRRELRFVAIGESSSGRTAAEAEDLLGDGCGR
jgi:hypothetical protein